MRAITSELHLHTAVIAAAFLVVLGLAALAGGAVAATSPQAVEGPVGPVLALKSADSIPRITTPWTDVEFALEEDVLLKAQGLPPRFALPEKVDITPHSAGVWQDLDEDYLLWRLSIEAPGALSLNLGFSEFELPKGARLSLYPVDYQGLDDARGVRVFTAQDNRSDGVLWTPLVQSDAIVVELLMPRSEVSNYRLALDSINKGYRGFGPMTIEKQGLCNIDVVCDFGEGMERQINSVGIYAVNGIWYCSGAMINNTTDDGTPYFLTADHCGLSAENDQSVVVYWNYQSLNCGDLHGGILNNYTIGSTFLVDNAASDATLILLDSVPHPDYDVTYAGWDRSDEASTTGWVMGIQHPSADEKSLSIENDSTSITSYYGTTVPGDGTHLRVADWDFGTTESGSTGSPGAPLFNGHGRIIGQLHGGDADCGNDASDWYGRLFTTWPVLSTYLDPLGTGAMTNYGYQPVYRGLYVTPLETVSLAGDPGGPFEPTNVIYTLENLDQTDMLYSVTVNVDWLSVMSGGSGTLRWYYDRGVDISLNSAAAALPLGKHTGVVTFTNLTDGVGTTTREIVLNVGLSHLVYSEPMDTDPGWTTSGLWAFGAPTGGGGDHGSSDPVSGKVGANVLGYNLDGDYENNLPATPLTSLPFDCTNLESVRVKFQRWLGVEEPLFDHASFSVSNNGADYITVWENDAEVSDGVWAQVEYDISAIADGQATVYLRWVMGETDPDWHFCGWNIDEVEIWAIQTATSAVGDTPLVRQSLSSHPNPFNPATRIVVDLQQGGMVRLNVYDVQGHLVRSLYDGMLPQGSRNFVWNGTDDQGNRVGSGVYFGRLVSGGTETNHKMVLLK
jgi:FlgD Ig-like domain